MSRRPMPFGVPCHDDAEWTCLGCGRVIYGECETSPGESELCRDCYETEHPDDGPDAA